MRLLPDWMSELPLQQQSVLMCALRGPDGIAKAHPSKEIHCNYRGSVVIAARLGRPLEWGEHADEFMSLRTIANNDLWPQVVRDFFRNIDCLPHHYVMHLMHAAQVLGYKHPDPRFRDRWKQFYLGCVSDMHLYPEDEIMMDERLNDFGREWTISLAELRGHE